MKVLLLFSVVLAVAYAQQNRCKPKYHFWRPFNGTIPRDAFVASTDEDGTRSFIAKIIPLDQYSWTVPVQFKQDWNHVDFSWCCKADDSMKVEEFIEILCTDRSSELTWKKANAFASELENQCCLVQGGIAWYGDHIYRAFIGKGVRDARNFIGRVYLENYWPGVHIMNGTTSTKILNDFEVLTYDCK